MNNLKHLVSTFSTEEQHQFIQYLEKKNKRKNAKNTDLFKHLIKNELNSKELCFKLYGTHKKDAYHALRKRLFKSIIDFIANNRLQEEKAIDMQIIKYIVASRNCLENKQHQIAYKILDKAETLAKEYFLFTLLNEIYHTKIQYAYTIPSLDLDKLVLKFKDNQKNHHLEDQLNIVYAQIKKTLNSYTHKGKTLDLETIVNKTLNAHNISLSDSLSFKSLYQLIIIVNISAFATKDYLKIEPFLINAYHTILKHKHRNKQLYYHIQILYTIANALFRNKKFNDSQKYLALMHEYMLNQKKKHYTSFNLKHKLLLALNLNYSNNQTAAIHTLKAIDTERHIDIEAALDIRLALIMLNFQKGDLKNAHQIFSKFYHTDKWYTEKAGKEWVIKKNLIEILLHIDLNNIDLVESRLLSFKRSYTSYLKDINQQRVLTYLGFVETYYKNPEQANSTKFRETVENAFNWKETYREDIFVISFYSWLKGKMKSENLYKTTLDLIKKAQKELSGT